jgi:hypothetical protein
VEAGDTKDMAFEQFLISLKVKLAYDNNIDISGTTTTYPHETYMRFAEWCGKVWWVPVAKKWVIKNIYYTTSDLFLYWIENVDKK